MLEDDLVDFIQGSIRSVWALELLICLRKAPDRTRTAEDLVRELRASAPVVVDNLAVFETSGLAVRDGEGWRYAPAAPLLGSLCDRLEQAWRTRPSAVMKAIVAAPNDKLQTFADAFRIRGERK